ncbi:MAG: hypothetical protein QNJ49_15010 [Mastigocoleus sp. MO_167.B18]|nr:hypothetical protein [Mastigocoleus sp. MO_167.B18]
MATGDWATHPHRDRSEWGLGMERSRSVSLSGDSNPNQQRLVGIAEKALCEL